MALKSESMVHYILQVWNRSREKQWPAVFSHPNHLCAQPGRLLGPTKGVVVKSMVPFEESILKGYRYRNSFIIWMLSNLWFPFWFLNVIWHLIFRGPKKGR